MTTTPSRKQDTAKSIEDIVKEQTVEQLLDDARSKPNLVNLLAFLRLQDTCIIRWNELKRHIETSDKGNNSPAVAMDPTLADVFLADKWKINAPSKRAAACLKTVALENAFNPVREYLESLRHLDLPEVTNEQLADCFGFDADDNLSIDLMRLHLRACASRGMNPGEKMDSLLILQGPQGNGKSSAIETASPEFSWYDETTRMSFDSKDSLSSLNSAFIYEFSEIEKILTTFDVAQFKSWITRKVDKYVEKYESISKDHPRRCCLFGTTNASTFLMDPTGARRFLICKNTKPANIKLLKTLRDALWKQSLVELENGLPYYLTNDSPLHAADQERTENATVSDPWEAVLSSYLSKCKPGDFVTSQMLLTHLNKPVDKLDMRDCKRIGNIMKRMKWEKARKRQADRIHPVDGYIKPELEILTDEQSIAILDG
jgi:putative DNA primase/helicase